MVATTFSFCAFVLVLILGQGPKGSLAVSEEVRLIRNLTDVDNYDKRVRPVKNHDDTVGVYFGLVLISLCEVNEAQGYITTQNWVRYMWNDAHLGWDPDAFGGIRNTRIPGDSIWRPDIALYNRLGDHSTLLHDDSLHAYVTKGGMVIYVPSVTLTSYCYFDMYKFPFDEHECILMFGSWTHAGSQMDLEFANGFEDIYLNNYAESHEWEIVAHSAKKNDKTYASINDTYPDLTFNLTIKRKEDFYTHTFIIPGIILSFLAPCIFALPVSGSSRYVVGVGMLITISVITSGFDDLLPKVNSTPIISRWYTALEALVIIALVISVGISNLANRVLYGQVPPAFATKILLGALARVLFLNETDTKRLEEESDSGRQSHTSLWERMARVLDRLFFLVYCVVIILLAFMWTAI